MTTPDFATPDPADAKPGNPEQAPAPARRGRPPSGGRAAILAAALELVRERGASRLTTKEVAGRAGVSEGSVFYHFVDRTGLMTAVIEDGLRGLRAVGEGGISGDSVHQALERFTAAVEVFLDQALVVMIAAQSDAELRTGLAGYLNGNNLGPHRGVEALAEYLAAEQVKGTIRDDVDPQAVAFFLISSCFMRASQRQMIGDDYGADLADRRAVLAALEIMIRPVSGPPTADLSKPAG